MALTVHCGTDLVLVRRIAEAVDRLGQPFLDRIWTAGEQDECRAGGCRSAAYWASLAARFAGKEAAAKALGTGIGREGVRWTDLVISRPAGAAPTLHLCGAALAVYRRLGGQSVSISMAHDADLATAFCVILAEGPAAAGTDKIGKDWDDGS